MTDYKPGVATGANTALPTMVIDPITGQTVPASDISDHLRIQLMDPKWREEQARAAAKQKDTALAEGDSIASSLRSLARKRGDIFGSAEVSLVFVLLLNVQLPGVTLFLDGVLGILWIASSYPQGGRKQRVNGTSHNETKSECRRGDFFAPLRPTVASCFRKLFGIV